MSAALRLLPPPDAANPPGSEWERRPGESRQAFAAFTAYRAMDRGQRSIRDLAAQLGKQRTLLARWSSRWGWQARVAAWDATLEQAADEATRDRLRAEALKLRDEQTAAARGQLTLARALMRECTRGLLVEQQRGEPDARTLAMLSQAIERAIGLERLALGLPTELTRADLALRETANEAVTIQTAVRRVIEETLCDECRARVTDELRRLSARQRALADRLGG